MTTEGNFDSEMIGPFLKKHLSTCSDNQVIDRYKLLRFIESLSMGLASVSYKTESLHGAGSPQAQRIMITRQSGLEKKIQLVKDILDIES